MPIEYRVPEDIFVWLRGGAAFEAADRLINGLLDEREPDESGLRVLVPRSELGMVLIWLWRTDRLQAMRFVEEVAIALSLHPAAASATPPLNFDELLVAIHMSLPDDVEEAERRQLAEAIRAEIPARMGNRFDPSNLTSGRCGSAHE